MAPKTAARSNLARSKAARSGWPVLAGTKVKLHALSKVARSGATRANYTSCRTFVTLNGVNVGSAAAVGQAGILSRSLTYNDQLNDVPTTGTLTFYKIVPVEGSDVVITLGSVNNLRREFGGTVVSAVHRYVGDRPVDQNMVYDAQLIDYSWGLTRKKVSGKYTTASVATIAAAIRTAGASGYTLQVAADIGATIIDEMTFTEQTVADALHQLVQRVGGDWFCDYSKVIQLFFSYTADAQPQIINRAHRTFRDLQWTRDLSQVVSRVYGDVGGSEALEAVGIGATLIPVSTGAWYPPAGGVVLIGQQRVNYSGVTLGGGGSLVGPGAAPTGAPNASLLPGAGVDVGSHDYAVTYRTASGESVAGPRLTVPVGLFLPPPTAPIPGVPGSGATGPDPGQHDYAVSFVISTGETVPGPRVSAVTAVVAPPTTGPTPTVGAVGAGPDPGTHDYAVVFATPIGNTPPGPIGGQINIAGTPIPSPTVGPTTNPATSSGAVDIGDHFYGTTFVTAQGETTIGPLTQGTALPPSPVANPTSAPATATGSGTNNITGGWLYYSYAYRTASGETLQSPTVEVLATLVPGPPYNYYYNVAVTAYASPDPAVTSIVFYRSYTAGSTKRQWATSSNVTTTKTDDMSNLNGPLAPTGGNTTVGAGPKQTIPLTAIPVGPAGTTARRLYRTPVGGGAQKLLTTIANNVATTYSDTTADSALGAAPPSVNTALVLTAVHLTNVPRATGTDAANVTTRYIYRRSAGFDLRYCGVINDNSSSTFDDILPNASLGAGPFAGNSTYLRQIPLTAVPLGNSMVLSRKVYRTIANAAGSTLKLVASIADNTTTTFVDTVNDAALGAAALTVGTAQAAQVQLTAVPVGAATVTARVIYRTKAGASQLQLLIILNDNTTTSWLDVAADATLGANVPINDTSLLQQPTGNVLAGSTALPCATVAAFLAAGGWAIAASQILRYTGITSNSLTGIPTTGPGSIGATITFNSTVVAAPMLTGVPTTGPGTIRYPIIKGDPVDVFVQEDDLAAQAAIRIQLPGSDGIIEDEIQDRRLSATEGRARCRARLNMLAARDSNGKVGIITVTYTCRDINSRAGRSVQVNIGPPINLLGTFMIQRVTASKFYVPHQPPTYQVEASSVQFSYEEFLRFLRDAGD